MTCEQEPSIDLLIFRVAKKLNFDFHLNEHVLLLAISELLMLLSHFMVLQLALTRRAAFYFVGSRVDYQPLPHGYLHLPEDELRGWRHCGGLLMSPEITP